MSRVEGVLNWYTENDKNDPNMYELVEVLSEYSRNADESKEKVENLVKLELTRLFTNGIIKDTNDSLVKVVLEFKEKALKGEAVSEELENYAKKVVGVSFWLKQESRGKAEPISYSNYEEYRMLLGFENDFDNTREVKPSSLRELSDFVAGSYKEVRVPRKQFLSNYRTYLADRSERCKAMIKDASPYIYPQEIENFASHWKTGGPLVETVNGIIDLGVGIPFETVAKRIEETADGFGLGFAKSLIIKYSKIGPDFAAIFSENTSGEMADYINSLRARNAKYEKELAANHLKDELGSLFENSESITEEERPIVR